MTARFSLCGRPCGARGFLFDKDGTLFTFDHWRAVMGERAQRLAERLKLPEAERLGLLRWMGATPAGDGGEGWGIIPLPRRDAEQLVAEHLVALSGQDPAGLEVLVAEVFREVDHGFPFEAHLRPTPGAEAMLRAIQRGSGRSAIVTHDIASAARHHLAAVGWTDLVDVVVGLDECVERKPSPQPILAACRELGLSPAETVMVGDTVTDLLAGRAAGCELTIGVLTGLGTEEELAPHADLVVPDLAALGLGWLPKASVPERPGPEV